MSESNPLAALAALIDGTQALAVEAASLVLGITPRAFRRLAAQATFPRPAKMGKCLTWRRRELLDWWDAERDRQNRGNRAA